MALLLTALVLSGCSIDVSLVGKQCSSDGACPDGLVCDLTSRTCQDTTTATTQAASWVDAMAALYRFESGGLSAAERGPALSERNSPESTDDAREGAAAAVIGADRRAGFDTTDDLFAFANDFSFGAWIYATADLSSPNAISRNTMTDGYFLERNEDNTTGTCLMEQEPMQGGAEAAAGSWPRDTWVHVVCRFRHLNPTAGVSIVVDGSESEERTAPWVHAPTGTPMSVAPTSDVFDGRIDELFFIDSVISAASIRRIRACGVDGSRCTCKPSAPTEYATCGDADCDSLPPCDQASP